MENATTQDLLDRARGGDAPARDALLRRYQTALTRWAHGRLPQHARDLSETADLVQLTLLRAVSHLDGFDPRHPGAFTAWLRQIFQNLVRDELRRSQARGGQAPRADLDVLAPQDVVASVGADSLASYQGDMFPEWKGDLIVGALKFQLVSRLDRDENGKILGEERMLEGEFGRIRDVNVAPDGSIWLLTDQRDGQVIRLRRAD